jgi:type II secretory pathway pseudopilin PulG
MPKARGSLLRGKKSAFTLLEVLLVIVLLLILGVVTIPNYKQWLAQAAQARCMANMRSIHVGLGTYLNDNKDVWPQGPSPQDGAPWAQFWIKTLKTQGIQPKTWECPVIYRMLGSPARGTITEDSIHYVPTMFDDKPGTPRRWATQPWLIERADVHGSGALICFTDGSIKPFNKVLAEQGLR